MRVEDLWSISECTFISRRDFEDIVTDILESYPRWNIANMRRLLQWIIFIGRSKDSVWAIVELIQSGLEALTGRISAVELQRRAAYALRGYNEERERLQVRYSLEDEDMARQDYDSFDGFDEFVDVDEDQVEEQVRHLEALEQQAEAFQREQMEEDEDWQMSTDDNDERDMDF